MKQGRAENINLNTTKYRNNLNKLAENIKPYLVYLNKKNMTYLEQKRRLKNQVEEIIILFKEKNILNIFTPLSGVSVDVILLNNEGIDNEFMHADNLYHLDNKKKEDISKSTESS